MYSSIMYEPHTVSILVDVINPVKYSVYQPAVGGVRWDAEAMKCYCLPPSPFLLALSFHRSAAEVAQRCQQYYSYLGWINWARRPWICLNHPLPLPVPRRANNLPWADTDDGKQHSRSGQKEEGCYYRFVRYMGGRREKTSADVWRPHIVREHTRSKSRAADSYCLAF